jgi:hypothetical protein
MGSLNVVRPAPGRTPRPPSVEPDANELMAQLGGEVAATLSVALERVNALAATGRIDRQGLRALREEIELARRIGMMGQQVSRFASGRVRLTQERLDLCALLREALQQRSRELEARGIEVRQTLLPADVMGDATLTFSLLQSLFDWSFEHTSAAVEFSIDHKSWPAHARLHCAFDYRPADEVNSAQMPLETSTLDTMSWLLLRQTAETLGLPITRCDRGPRTQVSIEFPGTVQDSIEGVSAIDLGNPAEQPANSRPLAGSHVLVVAARREVRNLVREAVRPMGLMIDFVTSVDEAREFCLGGMPHAVVHEAVLGGEAFERLRRDLLAEVPTLAFIQITEDSKSFEVRQVGERQFASVGRAAIMQSLPAALMFELSRGN